MNTRTEKIKKKKTLETSTLNKMQQLNHSTKCNNYKFYKSLNQTKDLITFHIC